MTEFIYRMPEKIKDLKLRNEEFFGRVDDINQSASFHAEMTSNMLLNPMGSYTYHSHVQNKVTSVITYCDFEDFLNLVRNDFFFNFRFCDDFYLKYSKLGELYNKDPQGLQLSLNYWSADNQSNNEMNYQNPSQKQVNYLNN